MNDESMLGLLLRALAQVAQQEYGEEYKQRNLNGAIYYGECRKHLDSAIKALFAAERAVGYSDGRKCANKEAEPPK